MVKPSPNIIARMDRVLDLCSQVTWDKTNFTAGSLIETIVKFLRHLFDVIMK